MHTAKLVIGIILVLFGGYITVMNWLCVYYSIKNNKFHSSVPLIGGLNLTIGSALLLNIYCKSLWFLCFLGIIIDYGSLPVIIGSLTRYFFIVKQKNK